MRAVTPKPPSRLSNQPILACYSSPSSPIGRMSRVLVLPENNPRTSKNASRDAENAVMARQLAESRVSSFACPSAASYALPSRGTAPPMFCQIRPGASGCPRSLSISTLFQSERSLLHQRRTHFQKGDVGTSGFRPAISLNCPEYTYPIFARPPSSFAISNSNRETANRSGTIGLEYSK